MRNLTKRIQITLTHFLYRSSDFFLQERNPTKEQKDCHGEDRTENSGPLPIHTNTGADDKHPYPYNDLPKVVRVSGHLPHS